MIRKFDALIALYIFGVITAELLGSKTFSFGSLGSFHLHASVAIFVMPLLFTITDVVVEVYGRERARSIVWSGLLCAALLVGYTSLATHLTPSSAFAPNEAAYDKVFGSSARIAAASLAAFAVSELLDVFIFAKLRSMMHEKALWFRNNMSNFVSQFMDSLVFLTLAFYSLERGFGSNMSFLFSLILPYWVIRCVLSVVETPLVYAGVAWLNKSEGRTEVIQASEA